MRRLSVFAIILAGLFYVAWPAWSAYQLKNALDRGDVSGVERGIDFPAVRQSLRPVVTAGIEQNLKEVTKGAPGSDVLIDSFGKDTLPKIVEASLDTLLTPEAIIRLYADGKTLREFIRSLKSGQPDLSGQIGGFVRDLLGKGGDTKAPDGGVGRDGTAVAAPLVPESRRLGLGNIKSAGLDGPLAITLGLARDPKATAPDLKVTMAFNGTGWRVTRLIPEN
ncbi:MAG: DUF2939 domain-containing protein [Deltaproteobacteria bacterium]